MNYPLISEYVEAIKAAEDNFEQLKHLRPVLDEDYFEHLLAEIREIRLSERRFCRVAVGQDSIPHRKTNSGQGKSVCRMHS